MCGGVVLRLGVVLCWWLRFGIVVCCGGILLLLFGFGLCGFLGFGGVLLGWC